MKPAKYILLFSLVLILPGIIGKSILVFHKAQLLLLFGMLVYLVTGIVYGILSLVHKKHRIEACMILLAHPLVLGILFTQMHWPAGDIFIILGSSFVLMGSIGFFLYTLIQNRKVTLGALYLAIGFGSLFFCFKFLRWPGASLLFAPAGTCIVVAIIMLLVKREKIQLNTLMALLVIGIYSIVFFSSSSQLYKVKHLNMLAPEFNFPENYYIYAWVLHQEGKEEEAKLALALAVQEAKNPYNVHKEFFQYQGSAALERYEKAIHLLEANQWTEYERPYNP